MGGFYRSVKVTIYLHREKLLYRDEDRIDFACAKLIGFLYRYFHENPTFYYLLIVNTTFSKKSTQSSTGSGTAG